MHIVILGAGYAGLHTALNLSKRLAGRDHLARITLVERNLYHQHVVLLHLVATGAEDTSEVAMSLDWILRRRAVRLHQGEVTHIDPAEQQVLLADGLALHYDRLVVALGAQTNEYGISGVAEHTWPLRSFDQAVCLRDHIRSRFREAARTNDPTARRTLLTFAIVGGGFTGVQLVGELAAWVRRLCDETGIPSREVRVALLEATDLLLQQFGTWATDEARRVLAGRGVSIHLNTPVERVSEQAVHLAGGKYIRAGTVIWTAGIRAPDLLAESGLTTDKVGRIITDRYLRSTGPNESRIFAAGDCASIPDEWDIPVPATASYALRQGEYLADTLWAEITGQEARPYMPQRLGQFVSLGPGEAVGDPFGAKIEGLPAALLKQAVEKWYLTTLL
jgi:NADH dehydrogenase